MRPTAGLIVIGDEILKGSTMDTNSHFICKKLHQLGVQISSIGDNVDDISDEIRSFSERFDYVFTTGGVGPTHDDKTYIGRSYPYFTGSSRIPSSFVRLWSEDTSHSLCWVYNGIQSKEFQIPVSAELLWSTANGKPSNFPVVRIRNVVTLPGVPRFCEKALVELQDQIFPSHLKPMFSKTIYTSKNEVKIANELSEIASKYDGVVEIGSYPVMTNTFFKTKLIVESESSESGQAVTDAICGFLENTVVHYDEEPWVNCVEKFNSFREREAVKNPGFVAHLDEAVAVLDDVLERYPLDQINLSFNGGKDCTILLHLFRLAVDKKYGPNIGIQGFHILCEDQFPEATQFIIDAARNYNIKVTEYPGPLKTGLEALLKEQPKVIAVLMGSRGTDPHGKYMKSPTEWTDPDWPKVLRVCPVLSWSYKDVWKALRDLCIPYCPLYDMGYTSLGGRSTTMKNPTLKVIDKDGTERYMPAYTLTNGDEERNGRTSN
ncbi:unnamed protein product [Haemonchus placei]|uniref:FAD synthase n=1 Tax=Haemonchus placei TaxID=6290 RepID=A0A0N4WPC5_HAEPC|nr:unnamed protein product [Haemonchus placei]